MTALSKARHVKALSVEQIQEYPAGADTGYSKAAEICDFPSPARVLKFAEEMGLSAEQRAAAQALLDRHKAQAREAGARS